MDCFPISYIPANFARSVESSSCVDSSVAVFTREPIYSCFGMTNCPFYFRQSSNSILKAYHAYGFQISDLLDQHNFNRSHCFPQ